MIEIDCTEMDLDDQLGLASAVSDALGGRGVALVKDAKLVIDAVSALAAGDVAAAVRAYVAKRADASHYSVETEGDVIKVHTPDPLARSRGRRDTGELLPPNLMKCPFCGFVTPYKELYDIHFRSHGFMM
ncbi:MAG: hypothetical protein JRN57_02040 [Nitrososphaerota archaeon]|nr:hypothetical protein [Nitrososphaerota archaeon]